MDLPAVFFFAVVLDAVLGDPRVNFHPVRLIGLYISFLERLTRIFFSRFLIFAGFLTCLLTLLTTYFVVYITIRIAADFGELYSYIVQIIWLWLGLSAGDLDKSVRKVIFYLREGDIVLARKALSQIVGRDTGSLDENEISRAAIETTAESFVDGIVSPLFFFLIGGVPLLWGFKALSTCDSMIGHKDERYILFGRVSARLDDFANFAGARLGFIFIFFASLILKLRFSVFHPFFCLKVFLQDRKKHASPNSGHPESAFAGALGVRLGGVNYYEGERYDSPLIFSAGRAPEPGDIESALRLMWTSYMLLFFCLYLLIRIFPEYVPFF